MREIKFRGKTLDGRWIYGDLWHRPYAKDCVTIVSFMEDTGTTGGLEVIPETVGQYTGLKDKNGKEIYEGDIVENTTQTVYLGDKYEVVWNKNYAGYQLMSDGFTSNIPLIQNFMSYKVIGNIYENPELLNVEQTGGTERKEREMEK